MTTGDTPARSLDTTISRSQAVAVATIVTLAVIALVIALTAAHRYRVQEQPALPAAGGFDDSHGSRTWTCSSSGARHPITCDRSDCTCAAST